MGTLRTCVAFLSLAVIAALAPPLAAESGLKPVERLEEWIPSDVIGYLKVRSLGPALDTLIGSDFWKEVLALDVVQKGLEEKPGRDLRKGLDEIRKATGQEPAALGRKVLGREAVAGVWMHFDGVQGVVLTRGESRDAIEELLESLRSGLAERLGAPPRGAITTHGEETIESFDDKLSVAVLGSVLAVANRRAAIERVIDLATGKAEGSVAASAEFRPAGAGRDGVLATLAVRPRYLPRFDIPEKADNPLGSLLVQGWLGGLAASQLLTLDLRYRGGGDLELELASHLGADGLPARYQSFFPKAPAPGLAARLVERGVTSVLSLQRDLAAWWESREDLLDPRATGGLTQFSQVMNIVFGGRSFQDEILPLLGSNVTLVARNQEYADLPAHPSPALPGFAAIFELKDAAELATPVVVAFQSLIGIINADQAQKKKEMALGMLLKTEKVGDAEMHTVALNFPRDAKPGIAHNFTPSLAVAGSRVILSSSRELARFLVEELGREGKPEAGGADFLVIDGKSLGALLGENLDFLIADNMRKKGIGKEESERELKPLFQLLERLDRLRVESTREGETLRLKVGIETSWGGVAKDEKDRKERGEARF